MGSNGVDPQGEKLFFLENVVLEFILILTCRFCFQKSLDAGVCTAYSLRGTKRGPQIVLSDLEQGRSYGPLLTRGAETKRANNKELHQMLLLL